MPLLSISLYYLRLILIFTLVLAPIWLFRGEIPGGNLISLLLVTSVSAVFYLLIAKLLKISEVTDLLKVILSRKV